MNFLANLVRQAGVLFGRAFGKLGAAFGAGMIAGIWQAARSGAANALSSLKAQLAKFGANGEQVRAVANNLVPAGWRFQRQVPVSKLESIRAFFTNRWPVVLGGSVAVGATAAGAAYLFGYLDDPNGDPVTVDEGFRVRYSLLQEAGVIDNASKYLAAVYDQSPIARAYDSNQSEKINAYLTSLNVLLEAFSRADSRFAQARARVESLVPNANPDSVLIALGLLAPEIVEHAVRAVDFSANSEEGILMRALANAVVLLPEVFVIACAEALNMSKDEIVVNPIVGNSLTSGSGGVSANEREIILSIRRLEELTGLSGLGRKGVPLLAEFVQLTKALSPEVISDYYEKRNVYLDR